MKKLITELTVITVMLLLGVWNVNGQTGSILLETNFENWKPTIGVDQANGTYSVPDASLKIQGPKFNNSSTPNAGTVGYPNYFRFGSAGSTTNQFIEVTPSKEFVNGGRITVVISTNSNAGATDVFSIADGPSASTDISKTFANFNQIGKVHTTVSVDLPTDYTGIKNN